MGRRNGKVRVRAEVEAEAKAKAEAEAEAERQHEQQPLPRSPIRTYLVAMQQQIQLVQGDSTAGGGGSHGGVAAAVAEAASCRNTGRGQRPHCAPHCALQHIVATEGRAAAAAAPARVASFIVLFPQPPGRHAGVCLQC